LFAVSIPRGPLGLGAFTGCFFGPQGLQGPRGTLLVINCPYYVIPIDLMILFLLLFILIYPQTPRHQNTKTQKTTKHPNSNFIPPNRNIRTAAAQPQTGTTQRPKGPNTIGKTANETPNRPNTQARKHPNTQFTLTNAKIRTAAAQP
jgi:hypothetical protein